MSLLTRSLISTIRDLLWPRDSTPDTRANQGSDAFCVRVSPQAARHVTCPWREGWEDRRHDLLVPLPRRSGFVSRARAITRLPASTSSAPDSGWRVPRRIGLDQQSRD